MASPVCPDSDQFQNQAPGFCVFPVTKIHCLKVLYRHPLSLVSPPGGEGYIHQGNDISAGLQAQHLELQSLPCNHREN
jgi:hypothetical protein